jgi:putative phosphoesterase
MGTILAIFSDVHGNLPALEAVLADIEGQGVAAVYHLGDLVGYNPWPNETAAKVREAGIAGVIGNYDLAVVSAEHDAAATYLNPTISAKALEIFHWTRSQVTPATREYLRSLPDRLSLEVAGWRLLLTHGSPRSIREYLRPRLTEAEVSQALAGVEAQVIVTGHTHLPQVRRVAGKWLINPGSVGFPKDGDPRAAYALIELGHTLQCTIRRVAYPWEKTAARIIAAGLPAQAAEDVRQGRRLRRSE